jgi:hypothetical protein
VSTSLETLLREAMTEHTESVPHLSLGAARLAAGRGSRARRLRLAGASVTVVALAAGGTAAAVLVGHESGDAPVTAGGSGADPSPLFAPNAAGKAVGQAPTATAPADLEAVSLPDPAPGFPVRRVHDQRAALCGCGGPHDYWTMTFLVGVRPDKVTDNGDGSVGGTPTGPEASVIVTDGAVTLRNRVVGHVTVGGRPTTVLDDDGRAVLLFAAGRFAVQVWGDEGATADQLVTLADALQGLPQ